MDAPWEARLLGCLTYPGLLSLSTNFPLGGLHSHKALLYHKACETHPDGLTDRTQLCVSRWAWRDSSEDVGHTVGTSDMPAAVPIAQVLPSLQLPLATILKGVFTYPTSDDRTQRWHVNFADYELFGYATTGLFAQDEMQAAEMPALAHLAEALPLRNNSQVAGFTRDKAGAPTPVLVSGAERRIQVLTDPDGSQGRPAGLYGNNFARASSAAVNAAVLQLSPPVVCNIVAMEAPKYGAGKYTKQQLEDILHTALVGFSAAKAHSRHCTPEVERIVIHTGHWGCGAFGGNRQLMAILQVTAACIADVELVYHAFDEAGVADVEAGLQVLEQMWGAGLAMDDMLERLLQKHFLWGTGDGS